MQKIPSAASRRPEPGDARLRHPTSRLLAVAAFAFAVPAVWLWPRAHVDGPDEIAEAGDPRALVERDLRAEVERLRAEREHWTDSQRTAAPGASGHAAAAPAVASAGGGEAVEAAGSAGEVVDALLAELLAQLQGGRLRARFLHEPGSLARLVLDGWLSAGDPHAALAILRRLPPELIDSDQVLTLGEALKEAGDRDGAREALLFGMHRGNDEWALIAAIADVDPVAGLARLREIAAQDPDGAAPGLHTKELELLLAAGRTDEAKVLLQSLALEPVDPENDSGVPSWLAVLVERSPALALETLARGEPNGMPPADVAVLRAHAQKAVGDTAGAKQTLTALLRTQLDAGHIWGELAELDAAEALRLFENIAPAHPDPGLAARHADLLLRNGRNDEAAGILLGIATIDWNAARDGLLRAAPTIAITKAREMRDDELLGDAADAAWEKGNHQQAIALWREAAQFDPSDGEWTEKLRRAAAGSDPINGH